MVCFSSLLGLLIKCIEQPREEGVRHKTGARLQTEKSVTTPVENWRYSPMAGHAQDPLGLTKMRQNPRFLDQKHDFPIKSGKAGLIY